MTGLGRYRLINARPSPFGRRVAIALIEKGVDFEVTYDVPWGPDTCTPEYSPFQQLPILVTPEGETLYESGFILEWLETKIPSPPLLPADPNQRLEARRRQMLGERLMDFAQALVFEYNRPEPSQHWIERQSRKVFGGVQALEKAYSEGGRVAGYPLDMGDIAAATTLLLFDFIAPAGLGPDLPEFRWRGAAPALTEAVERLDQRPSFAATRPQPMDVDLKATVRT